jgi:hypothetical protein
MCECGHDREQHLWNEVDVSWGRKPRMEGYWSVCLVERDPGDDRDNPWAYTCRCMAYAPAPAAEVTR